MIRLTCTQCKTTLEMDDAFAGGVCRCQHCGTIQTVPSHLKGNAVATETASAGLAKPKSLHQGGNGAGKSKAGAGGRAGTGLFDLADAVASSGLSRRDLTQSSTTPRIATASVEAPAAPASRWPLLAAGIAIIIALIGVIVILATRGGGTSPTVNPNTGPVTPQNVDSTPVQPPVAPKGPTGPHFVTVPVTSSNVVYVIDRGDAARQTFDSVKAAVFNSVDSLGPNRKFALIFWGKQGEKDWKKLSFPEKGLAAATPENAQALRDKFSDLGAVGASEVSGALKQALALKPEAIYLVTAKGYNLGDDFPKSFDQAMKGSATKIYTIDLANGNARKILEPIANKFHGVYSTYSSFDDIK